MIIAGMPTTGKSYVCDKIKAGEAAEDLKCYDTDIYAQQLLETKFTHLDWKSAYDDSVFVGELVSWVQDMNNQKDTIVFTNLNPTNFPRQKDILMFVRKASDLEIEFDKRGDEGLFSMNTLIDWTNHDDFDYLRNLEQVSEVIVLNQGEYILDHLPLLNTND